MGFWSDYKEKNTLSSFDEGIKKNSTLNGTSLLISDLRDKRRQKLTSSFIIKNQVCIGLGFVSVPVIL